MELIVFSYTSALALVITQFLDDLDAPLVWRTIVRRGAAFDNR